MRKWGLSLFFRFVKLEELGVLEVAVHAADGDVQEAGHAVEETQAQDVELEEAHHRREQKVEDACAASELVGLARGEGGVAVLALKIRGEVVARVVQEIAFERSGRHR